jgi:hypothetical protein
VGKDGSGELHDADYDHEQLVRTSLPASSRWSNRRGEGESHDGVADRPT